MKFEIPQEPLKRLLDDPRLLWLTSFYRHIRGDTDWQDVSLQNSWVDYGGADPTAQYKLKGGVVYIKGLIKSGTATAGTLLFTLPEGYRPLENIYQVTVSNNVFGYFFINPSGEVRIQTGSNTWFSLVCSFIAEQ